MSESQHTAASSRTRGNDPSAYVSPEEEAREEQQRIALELDTLASAIANETDEIWQRAERGSWRWPAGRAALEALLQDMTTMKARIEQMKDMG
jgi:hypothetical protein